MATPAELRMLELLDKWLGSLDLHLKYSALDAASYAKIQNWPVHQRPNRWIIELARQRTVALRTQVEDRVRMGDSKFADSLEMMIFLANLVGIQHIERYIPLAEREHELPQTPNIPVPTASSDEEEEVPLADTAVTGTREMPPFAALESRAAPDPAPPASISRPPPTPEPAAQSAQAAADAAEIFSLDLSLGFSRDGPPASRATTAPGATMATGATAAAGAKTPAAAPAEAAATVTEAMRVQVLADAERLLQWGRRWFELPELITRMADRPPLIEVRRILRENRAALDKKIKRS
jgi:pyruvate/2-oxoglutarate dehydrogenase complex dihydrolipoamide acyltransferase (E2) component